MNSKGSAQERDQPKELEQAILTALSGIRYGSVEIIVHDSKVIRIERKEKIRLNELPQPDKG